MDNTAFSEVTMQSLESRKIAKAVKKSAPTELRRALVADLEPPKFVRQFQMHQSDRVKLADNETKQQAEQIQNDVDTAVIFDEAARAMAETLQKSIKSSRISRKLHRTRNIEELTDVLHSIVSMIQQKNEEHRRTYHARLQGKLHSDYVLAPFFDDELIHINVELLASASESQVWQRTYEQGQDMDEYMEHMELDITDLGLWATHFESELDGYKMFREHFFRSFSSEQQKYLTTAQDAPGEYANVEAIPMAEFTFVSTLPQRESARGRIDEIEGSFQLSPLTLRFRGN